MRTKFLDWEDKALVQLAAEFERQGIRITWSYVARRMAQSKRTGRELQLRMASLKRTHGRRLAQFPRCFFGRFSTPSSGRRQALADTQVTRPYNPLFVGPGVAVELPRNNGSPVPNTPGLVTGARPSRCGEHQRVRDCDGNPPEVACIASSKLHVCTQVISHGSGELRKSSVVQIGNANCESGVDGCSRESSDGRGGGRDETGGKASRRVHTEEEAACLLQAMFGDVRPKDIRQKTGRPQENAGEILPAGVAVMIKTIGPLRPRDVFLDIGAGIGNVLCQVALTTDVGICAGIEMRKELCDLATERIELHTKGLPSLKKVALKCIDVRDAALSRKSPASNATVIFANVFLFEEDAKLVVTHELGAMEKARIVVATSLFCPRHRATCTQPFCKMWQLVRRFDAACSWKSALHPMYMYERRTE